MKVTRIDLDDDEMPSAISVTLTSDEAGYLAVVLGRRNGIVSEADLVGGSPLNSEIYNGLTGVFHRFYEDGMDEWKRSR